MRLVTTAHLRWDLAALGLPGTDGALDVGGRWRPWLSLAVFLLGIPAGYLLGGNGPWVLLLLLPHTTPRLTRLRNRVRHRPAA